MAFLSELLEEMVSQQLLSRGIHDQSLIAVMRRLSRAHFVPKDLQQHAFEDRPLPIGFGQTISQPYIVALMTESACIRGGRVLEVGTGSGYQAAILGELAEEVYTIERIPELASIAEKKLEELGYANIHIRCGDGAFGWPEAAPFDAILVTAGALRTPSSLKEQLAIGGRMVIPVGPLDIQQLMRITRLSDTEYADEVLCPVRFVPLISG